jgi:hypothetical protein
MAEASDTFLSPDEIRELTGYAKTAQQIEALRRMSVRYEINGRGKPVIARAWLEGRIERNVQVRKTKWEPEFPESWA